MFFAYLYAALCRSIVLCCLSLIHSIGLNDATRTPLSICHIFPRLFKCPNRVLQLSSVSMPLPHNLAIANYTRSVSFQMLILSAASLCICIFALHFIFKALSLSFPVSTGILAERWITITTQQPCSSMYFNPNMFS